MISRRELMLKRMKENEAKQNVNEGGNNMDMVDANATGPHVSCMNCCNTAVAVPEGMALVLNNMDDDKYIMLKKHIKELEEEVEYLRNENNTLDSITSDICRILNTDLDCIVDDVNDIDNGVAKYVECLRHIKEQLDSLGV